MRRLIARVSRILLMVGSALALVALGFAVAGAYIVGDPGEAARVFLLTLIFLLPFAGPFILLGLWLRPPGLLRRAPYRLRQVGGALALVLAVVVLFTPARWFLDAAPGWRDFFLIDTIVLAQTVAMLVFVGLLVLVAIRLLSSQPPRPAGAPTLPATPTLSLRSLLRRSHDRRPE